MRSDDGSPSRSARRLWLGAVRPRPADARDPRAHSPVVAGARSREPARDTAPPQRIAGSAALLALGARGSRVGGAAPVLRDRRWRRAHGANLRSIASAQYRDRPRVVGGNARLDGVHAERDRLRRDRWRAAAGAAGSRGARSRCDDRGRPATGLRRRQSYRRLRLDPAGLATRPGCLASSGRRGVPDRRAAVGGGAADPGGEPLLSPRPRRRRRRAQPVRDRVRVPGAQLAVRVPSGARSGRRAPAPAPASDSDAALRWRRARERQPARLHGAVVGQWRAAATLRRDRLGPADTRSSARAGLHRLREGVLDPAGGARRAPAPCPLRVRAGWRQASRLGDRLGDALDTARAASQPARARRCARRPP